MRDNLQLLKKFWEAKLNFATKSEDILRCETNIDAYDSLDILNKSTELNCDICGEDISDIIYHMAGILKDKLNKHIHLCSECFEKTEVINFDEK